jgi:hypothetical protein
MFNKLKAYWGRKEEEETEQQQQTTNMIVAPCNLVSV